MPFSQLGVTELTIAWTETEKYKTTSVIGAGDRYNRLLPGFIKNVTVFFFVVLNASFNLLAMKGFVPNFLLRKV